MQQREVHPAPQTAALSVAGAHLAEQLDEGARPLGTTLVIVTEAAGRLCQYQTVQTCLCSRVVITAKPVISPLLR